MTDCASSLFGNRGKKWLVQIACQVVVMCLLVFVISFLRPKLMHLHQLTEERTARATSALKQFDMKNNIKRIRKLRESMRR